MDGASPGALMTVSFHPQVDVRHMPAGDVVVLPIPSDRRPLRGLAGLVDWRLHGMISRLLTGGMFTGHFGETCLVPGDGYVPVEKILLFGTGPEAPGGSARLERMVTAAARAIVGLEAPRQLWPLAALGGDALPVDEALALFFDALASAPPTGERAVVIVGGGAWTRAAREHFTGRSVTDTGGSASLQATPTS